MTKAELVAGAERTTAGKVDLQQLFGFDVAPLFILQCSDDFPAGDVDDLPARRVDQPSVDTARQPARLAAKSNAFLVLRRRRRRVEDVRIVVRPVGNPDFFLVMGERDAVADRAVPPGLSLDEGGRGNFVENLAGLKIRDCDAEQIVDVDVDQRLLALIAKGRV